MRNKRFSAHVLYLEREAKDIKGNWLRYRAHLANGVHHVSRVRTRTICRTYRFSSTIASHWASPLIMRRLPSFAILLAFAAFSLQINLARSLVIPSLSEHLFPSTIPTHRPLGRLSRTYRRPRRPHTARTPNFPNLRTQSLRMKKYRTRFQVRLLWETTDSVSDIQSYIWDLRFTWGQ